jgi:hypothetical protein
MVSILGRYAVLPGLKKKYWIEAFAPRGLPADGITLCTCNENEML